jgi:hypothetical protein
MNVKKNQGQAIATTFYRYKQIGGNNELQTLN